MPAKGTVRVRASAWSWNAYWRGTGRRGRARPQAGLGVTGQLELLRLAHRHTRKGGDQLVDAVDADVHVDVDVLRGPRVVGAVCEGDRPAEGVREAGAIEHGMQLQDLGGEAVGHRWIASARSGG